MITVQVMMIFERGMRHIYRPIGMGHLNGRDLKWLISRGKQRGDTM